MNLLYKSFARTGGDQLLWRLDSSRLRILCYHGVCEDRLANEPWVPQFFVTQSVFEKQLAYLQRNARVLPLSESIARLRDGSLPPRCVSLTFDDGYANNLHIAYPLLCKYQMPATIFVSTAYIESGEFFPFLKLKLIRQGQAGERAAQSLIDYKSNPVDLVMQCAAPWWAQTKLQITSDQRETLRPLTIEELRAADSRLIDVGAHTDAHCILTNENSERRQTEIRASIHKVATWIDRRVRLFSYPNGQRGDFGEADKQVLRAEGIEAAVTGIAGANSRRTDLLELKRYPVGLFHDGPGFSAELTGLRSTLRMVARSLS